MKRATSPARSWFTRDDCDIDEFRRIVEQKTDLQDWPRAIRIESGVPVYGADDTAGDERKILQAELCEVLMNGPGVFVVEGAFAADVLDRASAAFEGLIQSEQRLGIDTGDHFAAQGSNDRLWGALEKLAAVDPQTFVDYYANDALALVCTAWLGPNYQIVSEPNVVNPASSAQIGHRDYHLGMFNIDDAIKFPAHVHRLSAALTLQAGIAHVDMALDTGPTAFLPYSQTYETGYLSSTLAEFQDYFAAHFIQVPLRKGDIVVFNPSLMHGAGANTSRTVRRIMNLLQISSAFGRAAATVNTEHIARAIYPVLRTRHRDGIDGRFIDNVITAGTEGYSFPTNLDRDRPLGALFPESQARLVWRALDEDWNETVLHAELAEQTRRRQSSFE